MPFDPTLDDRLRLLAIRQSDVDEVYVASYPLFLEYFRTRVSIGASRVDDVKIAVYLVYSWMGRARLQPHHLNNFGEAAAAIASAASANVGEEDLKKIRSFAGGSVIATSKFLHFLAPQRYAIWDQHVARAAYRFEHHYQYDNVSAYLTFLEDIRGWSLPADADELIMQHFGADISVLRRKELALFHLGVAEQ